MTIETIFGRVHDAYLKMEYMHPWNAPSLVEIINYERRRAVNLVQSTHEVISHEDPEMFCFESRDEMKQKWEAYITKTLQHKLDVFEMGIRLIEENESLQLGAFKHETDSWIARLASHDLSKFSVHEISYAAVDFSNPQFHQTPAFRQAWEHHLVVNDHHPKFWMMDGIPSRMFRMAITEMIVDWIAMSKAHSSGWKSVDAQIEKFKFTPDTLRDVNNYLTRIKHSQVFADVLGPTDPLSDVKHNTGIW